MAAKSCPFCGDDRITQTSIRDGRAIACVGCGAMLTAYHGRSDMPSAEDRALAAWNRRPESVREALVSSVLLEALRFYGDPANWQDFIARPPGRDSHYHSAHAHLDKGERARAAIATAEAAATPKA